MTVTCQRCHSEHTVLENGVQRHPEYDLYRCECGWLMAVQRDDAARLRWLDAVRAALRERARHEWESNQEGAGRG
jgi:hypothetical protein